MKAKAVFEAIDKIIKSYNSRWKERFHTNEATEGMRHKMSMRMHRELASSLRIDVDGEERARNQRDEQLTCRTVFDLVQAHAHIPNIIEDNREELESIFREAQAKAGAHPEHMREKPAKPSQESSNRVDQSPQTSKE